MTNEEPKDNSNLILGSKKDWLTVYKLSYDKTEWGLFYPSHTEYSQLQLQKALEKNKNEVLRMRRMSDYDRIKYTQHIFYKTEWNEKEDCFKTPEILLRDLPNSRTSQGCISQTWFSSLHEYQETQRKIFKAYYDRMINEHKEVKRFYERRKEELEKEQKEHHKERANEEVECPCCKSMVARTNLARHKKSKKCMESLKK